MSLPENLVPAISHLPTSNPMIMKPVFGTVENQYVEFYMEWVYDDVKTSDSSYELQIPIEMCRIVNDRYSDVTKRVCDLSIEQRTRYADLYRRFKEQKDSLDTSVEKWAAVSPAERALLSHCGFLTVEQLWNASNEQAGRLGPSWQSLKERAGKHVRSKEDKIDLSGATDTIRQLREQIEKERKDHEDRLSVFLEKQAAKSGDEAAKKVAAQARMAKARAARKVKKEETGNEETSVSL